MHLAPCSFHEEKETLTRKSQDKSTEVVQLARCLPYEEKGILVCVDILATVIPLCLLDEWLWLWVMQGFYFCGALFVCVDMLATVTPSCRQCEWLWLCEGID